MDISKAYAPGNVSCLFKIHDDPDPRWAGSMGLGFTVNQGVIATVSQSHITEIIFNGEEIDFPTVHDVISFLTHDPVRIELDSKLPLGSGFGLSGASALATAYALNELLSLKKEAKELAIFAHTADAKNKTGLGDVVSQYFGGCLAKFVSSSEFMVQDISLNGTAVYCKQFSKLSTPSVLSDPTRKERINRAADLALMQLKKMFKNDSGLHSAKLRGAQRTRMTIKFADLIKLSKEYAVESRLLTDTDVISAINSIEKHGGHASMIMLGNAVFSDIPFVGATLFEISDEGAHLIQK